MHLVQVILVTTPPHLLPSPCFTYYLVARILMSHVSELGKDGPATRLVRCRIHQERLDFLRWHGGFCEIRIDLGRQAVASSSIHLQS